jgi:hypothetical protein
MPPQKCWAMSCTRSSTDFQESLGQCEDCSIDQLMPFNVLQGYVVLVSSRCSHMSPTLILCGCQAESMQIDIMKFDDRRWPFLTGVRADKYSPGLDVQLNPAMLAATTYTAPLHSMVDRMIRCYCLSINFQYSHLPCWEQQEWLRRRAEAECMPWSSDQRRNILQHLLRASAQLTQ